MALSRRIALRDHVTPPEVGGSRRERRAEGRGRDAEKAAAADALPGRFVEGLRRLRVPARRLAASEAVLRALSNRDTPEAIGGRLIDLASDWFGGDGWATLGEADGRGVAWVCDRGIASSRRSAITALANRVADSGRPEWAADVSRFGPTALRARFGALALPLHADGRIVGVLVGIETGKNDRCSADRGSDRCSANLLVGGQAAQKLGPTRVGVGQPAEQKLGPTRVGGGKSAAQELDPTRVGGGKSAAQKLDQALDGFTSLSLLLDPIAAALHAAIRLAKAEKLSSVDDLTGLYNARFLAAAMQRETKRALRTQRSLSVLFVDLDGFKGINDRWGHLSGSRALVEAAYRIAAGARETDIVARYGGDEFAIVLPETPAEGALIVARRVRERIAAHVFLEAEGICYRLTASVGAASLSDAARTPEDLIAAADAAMYRVKARGKNGIEMAGPGDGPARGQ